jgi:hypothetical protein
MDEEDENMIYRVLLLLLIISLGIVAVRAQDADVMVPDVTGLSIPQAAAALNRAGLLLGQQTALNWTLDSGAAPDLVAAQSVAAGTMVAADTSVDVVVPRTANMQLIYDDNDLTLVNMSDTPADMRGLRFMDVSGTASFAATRLTGELRARQCVQVWSIGRNGPKGINECRFIQNWLSTRNRSEHFWTAVNGIQEFAVLDNTTELARCPAAGIGTEANPLRCQFFYGGGAGGSELTDYIYFAYTPQAIAIINMSEDRWMPTDGIIYNYNPGIAIPGVTLRFGDPQLFGASSRRSPGEIERLAPGQCIVLTSAPMEADAAPQPCHVVAQRDLVPQVAFWLADFQVESVTSGRRLGCPAAIAERLTLCILSR